MKKRNNKQKWLAVILAMGLMISEVPWTMVSANAVPFIFVNRDIMESSNTSIADMGITPRASSDDYSIDFENGSMLVQAMTPDGYYVDQNGVWIP